MIKSVVREHHWSPDIIGDLFCDNLDHEGLDFWYEDVIEVNKQLTAKK